MSYKLEYSKRADKQLSKLDPLNSRIIVTWMRNNIKGCENPRAHGGPLSAQHKEKWKYRVGKYRVLVRIDDNELLVLAQETGTRNN